MKKRIKVNDESVLISVRYPLAVIDRIDLSGLGMNKRRSDILRALAQAFVDGLPGSAELFLRLERKKNQRLIRYNQSTSG